MQKAPDEVIFNLAYKENRVLISADTDFGFIFSQWDKNLPSIILFRNFSSNPTKQFSHLQSLISDFKEELEKGSLIVLEPGKIRIKSLPF